MSAQNKKKRFTLTAMIKESEEQLLRRQRLYSRAVKKGQMDRDQAERKIAIQEAIVEALTWVNNNYEKVRATARNAKRNHPAQAEMNLGVTSKRQMKEGIPD